MTLEKSVITRLSFIKYLYRVGIDQSHLPEPMSSTSILTFHNAIELFLHLSAEVLDCKKTPKHFLEYWEVINKKLSGTEITQKVSMERLNKARVSLKHYGILPTKTDIEAFRASVTNFFEENTQIAFGISFTEISLIELVQNDKVRSLLKEAEDFLGKNEIFDSLDKISLGFELLIRDYENRKIGHGWLSPFLIGDDLTYLSGTFIHLDDELKEFVDKVRKSIGQLQNAVKMIGLGFDYRKIVRFRLFTPEVIRSISGGIHFARRYRDSDELPTKDNVEFCINFVIESALKLQEFDFDIT